MGRGRLTSPTWVLRTRERVPGRHNLLHNDIMMILGILVIPALVGTRRTNGYLRYVVLVASLVGLTGTVGRVHV